MLTMDKGCWENYFDALVQGLMLQCTAEIQRNAKKRRLSRMLNLSVGPLKCQVSI
jgi:hypothetical protein